MRQKPQEHEAPMESPQSPMLLTASGCPFDPRFFVGHFAAFLRDRCPDPAEGLPWVEIHLAGGEVLDLCHVVALAPRWVALAAFESDQSSTAHRMRTEIVPYEVIVRVTVRGYRVETPRLGFDLSYAPRVVVDAVGQSSAEAALAAASVRQSDSSSP